jgi:hypothetical protein
MNLCECEYEEALLHLRHAYRAMRRLLSASDDWTGKVIIEEEFRDLRDAMEEWALFHGVDVPPRRRRAPRRPRRA